MYNRPEQLQNFINTLYYAIASCYDDITCNAAERIFLALKQPGPIVNISRSILPVDTHLRTAFGLAKAVGGTTQAVAETFELLEPSLSWESSRNGFGSSVRSRLTYANSLIVGASGLERRNDVSIGASLLAPNVSYPNHHHRPEEIYFVLSGGSWRCGDGDWFDLGPGGIFYNEPNILHAMRSGETPLLAIWCLCHAYEGCPLSKNTE